MSVRAVCWSSVDLRRSWAAPPQRPMWRWRNGFGWSPKISRALSSRWTQCADPAGRQSEWLLVRDRCSGGLKGLASLVGGFLIDLLQYRLGGSLDQVLGLLESQTGQRAHLLDDLDLLFAGRLEDDVNLVATLFLGCACISASGGRRRGGSSNRSSRRHAEGGLEFLDELAELDQGQLLEGVKEFCSAELRHDWASFLFVFRSGCCQWICCGRGARFSCS